MKRTSVILVFLMLGEYLPAQTVQISASKSEYTPLKAEVSTHGISILQQGEELLAVPYTFPAEPDPSLEAYTLQNGAVIVRENIANFLLYDSFGKVHTSISNSTQSAGGESISEFATDLNGKTLIAYNPKVISGGKTGSRAKKLSYTDVPVDVFYSADRALSLVEVSANGQFIGFVSVKPGTDDQVEISDRFGNFLGSISFDQQIKGVTFSENGLYVTIYSQGRAAAYEIRSGKRVGSTSFRSSLQFAAYSSEDKSIVAISGSGEEEIKDIELHVISISARKIARQQFEESLTRLHKPVFSRVGSGRYTIQGFSRELDIRARF